MTEPTRAVRALKPWPGGYLEVVRPAPVRFRETGGKETVITSPAEGVEFISRLVTRLAGWKLFCAARTGDDAARGQLRAMSLAVEQVASELHLRGALPTQAYRTALDAAARAESIAPVGPTVQLVMPPESVKVEVTLVQQPASLEFDRDKNGLILGVRATPPRLAS